MPEDENTFKGSLFCYSQLHKSDAQYTTDPYDACTSPQRGSARRVAAGITLKDCMANQSALRKEAMDMLIQRSLDTQCKYTAAHYVDHIYAGVDMYKKQVSSHYNNTLYQGIWVDSTAETLLLVWKMCLERELVNSSSGRAR